MRNHGSNGMFKLEGRSSRTFFGSNLLMEVGCWINGPSFWRDEDTGVPKGHEALGV